MWTTTDIATLLEKNGLWKTKIEKQSLIITNEDNVTAYLAVSGDQILIEALLFQAQRVINEDILNKEILRTHKLFPLTSIGINTIQNQDYYVAFGALSSQSKAESIVIEISTLFQNIEIFIDLYQEHLK
ncbi:DUF2170 family protein [Photobacterium damselae]|uniref:DUF2170 domain-containing protein n=1 Tax=Photobacterium damselae TaxID=38293 RepID=A0ACD3T3H9_PHODM|nr:DUF2170 family protein [Photobacterium damselae]RDL34823.1 cytoplasmic protein [Photobacterium damselae]TMX54107.1 DUF2170 domain-containing protein [Photobacterium damselae]TMX69823.1 DUF2170 domain-containing protein [Photobacterium damselae]TMX77185.1 DUF2170 domain-containing protein [Photobacterium damselae]